MPKTLTRNRLLSSTLTLFLTLFLFAAAAGCADTATPSNPDLPTVDRAGHLINAPTEVNAIISMAPSMTLILIDLGLGDKIVAMDSQSAALVAPNPPIPVFDMLNPNAESLAALKPDLILASAISMMGNEANDPFALLQQLNICVAYIPTSESIAGIMEDIRFIAAITRQNDQGEKLITEMEREIDEIVRLREQNGSQDQSGQDQRGQSKTVYFEISAAPYMYSFGKGVFTNEMLELAGGVNIFADQDDWLPVEAESVLAANPDVIFTNVDYLDDPVGEIMARPGWEEVNAVKNARVFYVDTTSTAVPHHKITKGIRAMAELLRESL
ncbi:MAG: ABC transporter substrate-binding protein [Gracilibacteraceae bacterium]|jgi:iron complex transport system substrate-binding protein|nr:ABC transporter substrate-binding protein [Gracilibacteraceae bacterium]